MHFQEKLFNSVQDQRWIEITQSLKIHYKYSQFRIQQKMSQLKLAKKLFENTKHCLVIYSTNQQLKALVQPFWFRFKPTNKYCLQHISNNQFQMNLEPGVHYCICIYYYAIDFVYKAALSKSLNYFDPHQGQKSSLILNYIKGETNTLPVDKIFSFTSRYKHWKDAKQRLAIKTSGQVAMMILRGGAGTGKSSTSSKIAIQFCMKEKNVLMATVTHQAAKAIATHVARELQNYNNHSQILKFMSKLKLIKTLMAEQNNFEGIKHLDHEIKWIIYQIDSWIPIKFLFFNTLVTFQEYFCLHPLLRFYSFNTHILIHFVKLTNYQMSIVDVLINLNKIAKKIHTPQHIKVKYKRAVQLTIKDTNLVVSNAAKAAIINNFQQIGEIFQPYLVIFDEAAQSTMADLYAILSLDIKRLFLIGDEMQLSPFMYGPSQELRRSVLSYLQGRQIPEVILDHQYRMHPQICHLVSHLRYDGKLKNGFKENVFISQLKGFLENPILMVTHDSPEELPPEGIHQFGYCNIHQIRMIKMYIDGFPDEKLKQVGIVTIYRAQVELMKEFFAQEIKLGLNISTVDGYQGGEKQYLIASIVRSNTSGTVEFAEDKNRVTVLLSRASKGLMLIGNASTLHQGYYDNPWKSIISYLAIKNAIFHFTPDLNQKAIENSLFCIKRNTQKDLDLDLVFDAQDEEKQNQNQRRQEVHFEEQMLPFVKSDYK